MYAQASTLTPTPGSGEDDPVTERKYKENFYASVSPNLVMSNTISVLFLYCRCMKFSVQLWKEWLVFLKYSSMTMKFVKRSTRDFI